MIRLYNTMTRKKEEFKPFHDDTVTLYTCGLTVYSQPHIGNWVAYIYWDILERMLKLNGYNVVRVQNITDVGHLTSDEDAGEDKMLQGALNEGLTAWEVADKYIEIADTEAYDKLGLLRPTHMPRATQYVDQQIQFVEQLEAKGYTYTVNDGVYFDTSKLKDYGKLARLDIEGLQFGARVADTGKRNPTDFAVWKFSPIDQKRDMEWDSPWGKGFPGWHLECSAMALELLGETIDIHTGGIDHIPVHHTNEIAQSESLTGKEFARFWLHANHIKVNGTKMSKSLGNIYTLEDIEAKGISIDAFKVMILSKHYRTEGNFTWEILEAAANRLKHYEAVADLRYQDTDHAGTLGNTYFTELKSAISEELFNDLNTPGVLRLIDEAFDHIERYAGGLSSLHIEEFEDFLTFLDESLGLHLSKRPDIDQSQKELLIKREDARIAKDWDAADSLRKDLEVSGLTILDTPRGQQWERA